MAWGIQPTNKLIIHTQDFNGKASSSEYRILGTETNPAGGAAAAIAAGVQAISANKVTTVEIAITATQNTPGTPATGPYDRVEDKAKMKFIADDGSPVTIQLPGPRLAVFKSDHFNVDPAAALPAAVITAFLNNAVTAEGRSLTSFSKGYRRVPPRLKKH